MSSTRPSTHCSASKSTVLAGAGVQDAYWSDDEDEDAECPLCLEEMDVAEMGFKPCPCGYQICMFCYHHIKSNLNGRCPACRREYSEQNVEFTAVPKEDVKRQTQQKKRKERERKELDALGRKQFANVRVVQRNVVYVVGLGPRFAKEELIPTLRSNEYFGQYGKISKIILVKRHLPGSKAPIVGLYTTYHRREDAARAIHAVDGSPSPGGGGDVMRASHGTTKYCMSFLRGQNCSNNGCLDLHEWGDKNDCFTKEDLTTLKHSMKDAENQPRSSIRKKGDEQESTGLPRGTSWVQKTSVLPVSQSSSSSRQSRNASGRSRNQTQTRSSTSATDGHSRGANRGHDRRAPAHASSSSTTSLPAKASGKVLSQGSSSRPSTPAVPAPAAPPRAPSPAVPALARARAQEPPPPRSSTPASSVAVESDVGSSNPELETSLSPKPTHAAPAAPPGLPPPPIYQLSTQAQALLDDVRARREQAAQPHIPSPFPEFDRTLDSLGAGDFSFTWTMDPKIATAAPDPGHGAQEYRGSFDPFSASASGSGQHQGARQFPQLSGPPGISPLSPSLSQSQRASGYHGSFNPFADGDEDFASPPNAENGDGSRQESRFGFARRKPSPTASGSPSRSTFTSSPLTSSSPLPMYQHVEGPWGYHAHQLTGMGQLSLRSPQHQHLQSYEYGHPPGVPLPAVAPLIANPIFRPQHAAYSPGLRFQSFDAADTDRTTARQQRQRADSLANTDHASQATSFMPPPAPAEPSALPGPPEHQHHAAYGFGAPPGLSRRDSAASSTFHPVYAEPVPRQPTPVRVSGPSSHRGSSISSTPAYVSPHPSPAAVSTPAPAPVLLATDFPALPATVAQEPQIRREQNQPYILPAPPKAPEPKLQPQPVVPPRKGQLKTITKETKAARAEASAKRNAIAITPVVPTGTTKAPKNRNKQEKKEEPKPVSEQIPSAPTPTEPKKLAKAVPPPAPLPEPIQVPLFSKVSKKAKPAQNKVIKVTKEDITQTKTSSEECVKEATPTPPTLQPSQPVARQSVSEVPQTEAPVSSTTVTEPSSLTDLLDLLSRRGLDVASLAIFNPRTLDPDSQTPLQYDPLVHALSALSVGGGSFANNLPTVSIDSAVSSFQQLLETLTQTISDLLRLLPRTTWDDSSSFDGVLRDMLKGDDFLDDVGEDGTKDDEVTALTLALERRARWMEVQLAKLEELHRDINTAAVRAVLTFNDRGWDPTGFMPRTGKTLSQFDSVGYVQDKGGSMRSMSLEELQKASEKAKLEEKVVRQALQESIEAVRALLPLEDEV